jgi:serine/threonine-protein kinase
MTEHDLRRAIITACAAVIPYVTASTLASAQSSVAVAQAQSLYDEANRLFAAKQFEQACSKYAESHRLDPGIGTLLRLASCYERIGKLASAWASLIEAGALAHEKRDAREAKALARAAQLQPKLSRLNVTVSSAEPDLLLQRDGETIGRGQWGQALPIDPGTYKIEVTAPGKKPWSTSVEIAGNGKTITVEIPPLEPIPGDAKSLAPAAPFKAAIPPPKPDSSVRRRDEAARDDADNLSHAWQLGAFARADGDWKLRGLVSVFGLSYGIGDHVEVAAGAVLGRYGRDKGVWVGGTGYFLRGQLKPLVTVGTHMFFIGDAHVGFHGSGGLQWDPFRHLGIFIEAGIEYFPIISDDYEKFYLLPSAGIQGRL